MASYLRCYAVRQDRGWFALCLDLNLAAEADSFEEARFHVAALIAEYLADVAAHPGAGRIPRRAPLGFWLEYAWAQLVVATGRCARTRHFCMPYEQAKGRVNSPRLTRHP